MLRNCLRKNEIKRSDFGLVTVHHPSYIREGQYLVTEPYRAPELFCDGLKDGRANWKDPFQAKGTSDMWSMGIILMELIFYK